MVQGGLAAIQAVRHLEVLSEPLPIAMVEVLETRQQHFDHFNGALFASQVERRHLLVVAKVVSADEAWGSPRDGFLLIESPQDGFVVLRKVIQQER